ncbi:MAG: DNA-protecting protein DprA [Candidatus Omnitrophica bacterium]|nr:DNA-protecting protein DprA [Candidatus Omnitrophota bacterium]
MDDRERLIALNLVPGIGSLRLRRLLDAFGGLSVLWAASAEQLQQVEGIGPALAQQLIACRGKRGAVTEELGLARKAGCTVVTLEDGGYPAPLRQIHDPPLVLYMKGAWTEADETAVGIVGARRASLYGWQMAERLAYELALRGITVVSGLARGIDGAAHRGALKASPAPARVGPGGDPRGPGQRAVFHLSLGAPGARGADCGARGADLRIPDADGAPAGELPPSQPPHQRAVAGRRHRGGGPAQRGAHHGGLRAGAGARGLRGAGQGRLGHVAGHASVAEAGRQAGHVGQRHPGRAAPGTS